MTSGKGSTRIRYLLLAVLFLAGLAVLLYPAASDRWNRYRDRQLITEYGEAVAEKTEDYSEYFGAAQAYNQSLIGTPVPDAFADRQDQANPEYEALLNVSGDGLIGYVEIPVIDVKLPVYHYTTDEVLKKGAGHLFGSSVPVGGESTHSVISAHRGLPNAQMFTDLDQLEEGDLFYITVLSRKLAYEVDRIQVVVPSNTESLAIEEGEDYVTLVTCTPYAVNTHRLLVRGHRIDYTEETYEEQLQISGTKTGAGQRLWIHLLCALAGVLLSVSVMRIFSKREKNEG